MLADHKARLLTLVKERAFEDGIDIVLSSGKRSDFYINGKKITLHPEGLYLLAKQLLQELEAYPEITAVGGLTLGADPIAAAIAVLSHETDRPLSAFIVRKESKEHGTASKIEGDLEPGQKVAIIEDTITTGASARRAIEAVCDVGAKPLVVLALVDRLDADADEFRKEFDVRAVFTLNDLRA